jgi:hypothetical protein
VTTLIYLGTTTLRRLRRLQAVKYDRDFDMYESNVYEWAGYKALVVGEVSKAASRADLAKSPGYTYLFNQ